VPIDDGEWNVGLIVGPYSCGPSSTGGSARAFRKTGFCVMLAGMGNKDKGRKETKKAPKPKPKPEPGRRHELLTPAPPK
jgi:hypothetical protein